MKPITIDLQSPERAWPPFLDWMHNQGLDPNMTRAITIDPTIVTSVGMIATLTIFKLCDGKRYAEDGEVATEEIHMPITSLPPRRLSPPD